MTASANHQHSNRAQQLERLSAYLDDELDETERAALEEHLPICEECRSLLAELRETRSLLRTLPAPALPRSFLIPETGAIPLPLAGARRATAATSAAVQRRRSAGMLQWVGGLVATLGLLIFVATTLLPSGHPAVSGASSSSAKAPHSSSAALQHQPTAELQSTGKPATGGGFPSPATATVVVPAPTSGRSTFPQATQENAPPLGPIGGVLLLIGGAGLLLAGALLSRRRMLP